MLSVFIVACPTTTRPTTNDSEFDFDKFYAEFQNQKLAWESLNINDYMFVCKPDVLRDGYIPMWNPPLTIRVFPDKTPEITAIDVWAVGELPEWLSAKNMEDLDYLLEVYTPPPTITKIYSSIEWEIQNNRPHESNYIVGYEIVYNKDYHYPEYFCRRLAEGTNGVSTITRITAFEDLRAK